MRRYECMELSPTKLVSFWLFLFFSHDKYSTNFTIIYKRVDGVLGTRTRGSRMVGADESTELWRQPNINFVVILVIFC